ncbi:MAG: hypothetical protein KBC84_05145, partial [Proteobacteria bacterium]|nr:hypothetical protein [Pseudomonadota bacterium]
MSGNIHLNTTNSANEFKALVLPNGKNQEDGFSHALSSLSGKYLNQVSEIHSYAKVSAQSWMLYFTELSRSGNHEFASSSSNLFLYQEVEKIRSSLLSKNLDSVLGKDQELANTSDFNLLSLSIGIVPETLSTPVVMSFNIASIELTRRVLAYSGLRNLSFNEFLEQEDSDSLLRNLRVARNLILLFVMAKPSLINSFGGLKLTAGISSLGVVGEKLLSIG